ncbi:hemerythrin domain-containing protein [Polyangium aurulentum]|uniref:hemerythrin domain-containing protein n=1 Tax=Polyangium aurulentum TaxID=2567896 RepID=UPI0010AE3849|nr:hemerythrin domain-containing protein [Polyangium aurulentum]UQA60892.1 hemerythrin domain-containing protein [Polyangium aurulentum]
MEYDRMLANLFEEEDRAREMASKLMQIAQSSREACLRERESLVAFLQGPMERHMAYEEQAIFPQLERRGLGAEVQVAARHHAMIREDAEKLASARPDEDVSQLIFDVARRMLHHTNFEGDYIYPELTLEAWRDLMKHTSGPVL